jgi:membrane dipeptidase
LQPATIRAHLLRAFSRITVLAAHRAQAGRAAQSLPNDTPSGGGPMKTRSLVLATTFAVLLVPPAAAQNVEARAREIHRRVITMDTHDDIPRNFGSVDANPCQPMNGRQVDLPQMRTGGLDVAFFAVFVGQGERSPAGNDSAKAQAMDKFRGIHAMAEQRCPDQIEIAYHPDDVKKIIDKGKLVTVIGIENGYIVGNDLALVKTYYDLGGRYMTLAHTSHNDIADSSNPPQPEWNGLSPFGEKVVAEMNRVGMMVDVSHISKAAALHAMRISRAPVMASHSSTRALADVPRNMDDETLLALKQNNGVMQTVAFQSYVKVQPPERQAAINALNQEFGLPTRGGGGGAGGGRAGGGGAAGERRGGGGGGGRGGVNQLPPERRAEYDRRMAEINQRYPLATVKDFVDHIDHAVKLIGIDHVGISSDFDGGGGVVGWNNAAESMNVTTELVRRGYTEEQIARLWGGNLLRVWRDVERVAGQLQRSGTH